MEVVRGLQRATQSSLRVGDPIRGPRSVGGGSSD